MVEGANSRGDQPWQPQKGVYEYKDSDNNSIPVVGTSVLQFVLRVIRQVPRDTIVQENEDECKQSRPGSHDGDPGLALDISQIDEPAPCSPRFFLVEAVIWPIRLARFIATLERWSKRRRHRQSLERNAAKDEIANEGPNNDGRNHRKICGGISQGLVDHFARPAEDQQTLVSEG